MNNAKLKTSNRLQRVLRVLKRGGAYSTRRLREAADIEAVSATVSELRANGKRIECFRRGRLYYYMLARS